MWYTEAQTSAGAAWLWLWSTMEICGALVWTRQTGLASRQAGLVACKSVLARPHAGLTLPLDLAPGPPCCPCRSERKRLAGRCDVLVATPGRLIDHLENGGLAAKLQGIRTLVSLPGCLATWVLLMGAAWAMLGVSRVLGGHPHSGEPGWLLPGWLLPAAWLAAACCLAGRNKWHAAVVLGAASGAVSGCRYWLAVVKLPALLCSAWMPARLPCCCAGAR
jgi:hypothetical protein